MVASEYFGPSDRKEKSIVETVKPGIIASISGSGRAVCAALLGAVLILSGLPAHAELAISGQVAYNVLDRDSEDDITFQRNGYSESRFSFAYRKTLENGMNLEVVEEIGIGEAESVDLRARRQEIIVTANFGGIRFGQGNDAGDDLLNSDLSGTTVIQPIASQAFALGYNQNNYNGFDPGRSERIRYDSPNFGKSGNVSVQLGNDDEIGFGFRYNTEIAGGAFRLGVVLTETGSNVDSDTFGVLAAYALENGLNFALVFSSQDNTTLTNRDGDFRAAKVGFKIGAHAMSVVAGNSENPGNAVDTDSFGVAYVFQWEPGIELYAAINDFDSDNNAVDEDFFLGGARVKF